MDVSLPYDFMRYSFDIARKMFRVNRNSRKETVYLSIAKCISELKYKHPAKCYGKFLHREKTH